MKITLWRADNPPTYFGPASWWARDRETAEAYQDNPGFGGKYLYAGRFNADHVLDLTLGKHPDQWTNTGAIRALADEISRGNEKFRRAFLDLLEVHYVHEVLDDQRVQLALGPDYDWVRTYDSFPEGAETWLRLTPLSRAERKSIARVSQRKLS